MTPENATAASPAQAAVRERIDTIEAAYEFFLAYAAQGLAGDAGSNVGAEIRRQLGRAIKAVSELPEHIEAVRQAEGGEIGEKLGAFAEVVAADVRRAAAALALVDALPNVSSQMVDNMNASIHLRALLTDLFLLDEVFANIGAVASSGGAQPPGGESEAG